ncbi:MAG: SPOR domain-containing protein [Bacteroidales bacterium]|nr:SPOR domain-containing protein [Bacteroidales bacterium]
MKKLIFYSLVALIALGATSCKPKQTAYKAAYERAKEKEVVVNTETNVAPAATVTRTPTTPTVVRKERITPVTSTDASGLKNFSVVIGSFMNQTNATALKENMEKDGYKAILAQNEKQMYRVIVASFDTKDEAAAERDRIKAKYAPRFDDIWLLERQY